MNERVRRGGDSGAGWTADQGGEAVDRSKLDMQLTILRWYENWSEEHYASGFMTPDRAALRSFARYLGRSLSGADIGLEEYEAKMLEEFAALLDEERESVPQ